MKAILVTSLFFITLFSISKAQWTQCNGPLGGIITSFTSNGNSLYAGTDGRGLYRSNDNGATWIRMKYGYNGIGIDSVRSLATLGTTVFVGTGSALYRSKDNGETWVYVRSGGSETFAVCGSDIIISEAKDNMIRSTDGGEKWAFIQKPYAATNISSFACIGTTLFVGSNGEAVSRSTDNGETWTAANVGMTYPYVSALAVSGTTLYAGTIGNAVYQTSDNGTTWVRTSKGLTSKNIKALQVSGTTIFAGTDGGIFRSVDNGTTWTVANNGLTNLDVRAFFTVGTSIIAGTNGGGVFRSTNNGDTWESIGIPIQDVTGLTLMGTSLYASTIGSVYRSSDNGVTWGAVGLTNKRVLSITSIGTTLIAGLETDGTQTGINISTDSGTVWQKTTESLRAYIPSLVANATTVFAGADAGYVFRSTDNGITWTSALSTSSKSYNALAVNGNTVFAGNYIRGGIYRSTDNGDTWIKRDTGITYKSIYSLGIMGSFVFAGVRGEGIFRSGDNGDTWTLVGFAGKDVYTIAVRGATIYAVSNGVYSSSDNGDTWTLLGDNQPAGVRTLFVNENTLFATTRTSSVWKLSLPPLDVQSKTTPENSLLFCYPNPATSSITIDRTSFSFSASIPVRYSLSTLTGMKMIEFESSEPFFSIPLMGFAKGIYFLTATQGARKKAAMVTVVE